MINQNVPYDWFKGLKQNWRNDLIAAVSVALVAMPLALGIAIAANAPAMSGLMSAIIAGFVTTFIRGGHVSINGPGNSLIALVLIAMTNLNDGSGNTFAYVLAAFVISGGLQVLLGVLRLGRLAEVIPSSVIQGILAAIGIIIVAKQLHVALGTSSDASNMVGTLLDVFRNIKNFNPFVAIISLLGMLLLIFHSKISYKLFHILPAPMWVLIIAIPFVYLFGFSYEHQMTLFGNAYAVGPDLLVSGIPNNILDSIIHPNFGMLHKATFWLTVISITLINTVESLASTKAVDKLDSYKRKTNLNRDLIAVGLSTMVSGALGGLPIVTVIVRSTVNIHNNAKTRWSNFFHGALMLLFVLLLAPVIQKIPLAALAAILVFSGFKLTAPRVYVHSYEQGMEQLLFLVGTLVITLYTSLLWGVVGGIVLTLGVHILLARVPISVFFSMVFKPGSRLDQKDENNYELKVKGVANFLTILNLKKMLDKVPKGAHLKVNISTARLIDLTVLEGIDDFKRSHILSGGTVDITGEEHHVASTGHHFALKSQTAPIPHRLSSREQSLKQIAYENDWAFRHEINWNIYHLQEFHFFESRPIEYLSNTITGEYEFGGQKVNWNISDVTFDEGALLSMEVFHSTIQVIELPFDIPRFSIEPEGIIDKIFDRVMSIKGHSDIDFDDHERFSREMVLKGEDELVIRSFCSTKLISYLEENEHYHIESSGRSLLIFKQLRIARPSNVKEMVDFSEGLVSIIAHEHMVGANGEEEEVGSFG